MEEQFILKCTRCFAKHEEIRITHIDSDGNIFCAKCAAYLQKIGGYDLSKFNVEDFLDEYFN